MDELERLKAAISSPGEPASFIASRHGSFARIEPRSANARKWLTAYAGEEALWDDMALIIEVRYFPEFADAAIDDGHTFRTEY